MKIYSFFKEFNKNDIFYDANKARFLTNSDYYGTYRIRISGNPKEIVNTLREAN